MDPKTPGGPDTGAIARHTSPTQALVGCAALVVLLGGLHLASAVVTPLLLATFLAIICAPALSAMQHRGVPGFLAVVILFSAVGLAFFLLFLALQATAMSLAEQAPTYQDRLTAWLNDLRDAALAHGMPEGALPGEIPVPNVATVTGAARAVATGLGQFTATTVLVLLLFMFLLVEQRQLPAKVREAFPGSRRGAVRARRFLRSVYRYMLIKTGTSALTGLIVGIGLALIGVDFALLWAILAGLLNFIPTVGSIIAAVPAVLVALLGLGPVEALLAVALYTVVNVAIGSGLEPQMMGNSLDLSPMVVLISLMLWGFILGPIGMLLSIPLTMVAKIALDAHPDTRWLAVMLSARA